jgi:RING-box protein 1
MESKFKIKSIRALNSWCYNLPKNTDCTICRCNLNCESLYANEKNINSIVTTGICGHSFHDECIKPWIKNQPNCPICLEKWNFINK